MERTARRLGSLIAVTLGLLGLLALVWTATSGAPAPAVHARPLPSTPPASVTADAAPNAPAVPSTGREAVESESAPPAADSATDVWIVRGRVRRGSYGSFPRAPLSLRLHFGAEVTQAPFHEVDLVADDRGAFEWRGERPEQTVLVEVVPRLDDHKVGAATRVIHAGDAAPKDLQPYAYALDARVVGRVLDEDGAPIPGAEVESHLSGTTTGPDGGYELPMDSAYPSPTLRAGADGFACASLGIGTLDRATLLAPDLVLRRAVEVTGHVVDANGDPVVGATVTAHPRRLVHTTTDGAGRFRLGRIDPAKERTWLTASREGFLDGSLTIDTASTEDDVEIVLGAGCRVTGRVVTRDGAPVPGATVWVGSSPGVGGPSARADASGTFLLETAPAGRTSLWAVQAGYAAAEERVTLPGDGEELADVTLVLREERRLAGRVVDEDGAPVAWADVRAGGAGFRGPYPVYLGPDVRTDEDGYFELTSLRKKRFTITVWAEGCAKLEQRVVAGTEDLVLRVERAGRLAGRVVDGRTGAPLETFVVRFIEPELGEGERRLRGYGAEWGRLGCSFVGTSGYWHSGTETPAVGAVTGIEISAPGYAPTRFRRAVAERRPAPDAIVTEMFAGTRVIGVVVDSATGRPIPGVRVQRCEAAPPESLRRFVPDERAVAETDADGRFSLDDQVVGSIYLMAEGDDVPLTMDGPFVVEAGATTIERTIEVGSGVRLHGKVLDGHGVGRAGVTVRAVALELPGQGLRLQATTGDDGAYAVEGLVPSLYHVSVDLEHAGVQLGSDLLQLVEIGSVPDVGLDLQPKGHATLRGRIEFDGELPEGVAVQLSPPRTADPAAVRNPGRWATGRRAAAVEDRAFTANFLQPGRWSVRLSATTEAGTVSGRATVEVPDDGTVDVVLRLRAR
ncbi:MAG: carboxypeptidase regulatory-like domain-containing protein [Planctomycetota bacterium]